MKKEVKELKGTFIVMVTPFDENQDIDFNGLKKILSGILKKVLMD